MLYTGWQPSYGYEAWQLLVPGFDPKKPPRIAIANGIEASLTENYCKQQKRSQLTNPPSSTIKKFYPRQDTNVLTVRRSCSIMILTQHIAANESPALHMSWRKGAGWGITRRRMMTLFSQLTDQQLCLVLEELSKEVWSRRVGRDAFEDSFVSKTMYDLDALRFAT